MNKKVALIFLIVAIIICNTVTFKELSHLNEGYYKYSNGDATVTAYEIFNQGREIDQEFSKNFYKYKSFKAQYPNSTDTILYRLFKVNHFHFWRWAEYSYSWRFRLPYRNWEKIRVKRKPGFQIHQFGFTEF